MSDDKDLPESQEAQPVMCLIPHQNLQAVYNWLNSDDMTMPQREVRQAMKLIMAAHVVTNSVDAE
jgi:hypothetical protein